MGFYLQRRVKEWAVKTIVDYGLMEGKRILKPIFQKLYNYWNERKKFVLSVNCVVCDCVPIPNRSIVNKIQFTERFLKLNKNSNENRFKLSKIII